MSTTLRKIVHLALATLLLPFLLVGMAVCAVLFCFLIWPYLAVMDSLEDKGTRWN